MRRIIVALALVGATLGATLGAAATSAHAQRAVPDLKGSWTGKGKVVVLGSGDHHPGTQTPTDPARVRDLETTHVVEGQDGQVAWGRSSSTSPTKRSRSPGPLPATTRQSSAPTSTAIVGHSFL